LNQFEKRITRNLIEPVSDDAMKINVISRFLEWSVIRTKNRVWVEFEEELCIVCREPAVAC
jgi:hypothetical protein